MNQEDFRILEKTRISTDVVVINQCKKNAAVEFEFGSKKVRWIDKADRGLSKSRNLAIENASGNVCLLADDDLIYVDGYEKIVDEQFLKFPDSDILTFQVEGIERKFKDYFSKSRVLNFLTIMKVSSVEIAFRLESIKNKNIKFDETFGSGAKYFSGEEGIFLSECLKKGLNIRYVPVKIADLHMSNSTWFKGFNREYFIARGAIFTAMTPFLSYAYMLQFALRKYNLYRNELSFLSSIKYMLEGRIDYLKHKSSGSSK